MGKFEAYLEEFSKSVNFTDFLINLVVAAVLCTLLQLFYVRFGNAVSNRDRFAGNFMPLGLTTLLIITIVKSSIALSLGLVGALSIVRFRAAIKDPEELTYLFLTIGIGLAAGANQPVIALVSFVFIVGLLFLRKKLAGKADVAQTSGMYLHITTDQDELKTISAILARHFAYVELKRMDKSANQLELSYLIQSDSIDQLEAAQKELSGLSVATTISMVNQPDLVI